MSSSSSNTAKERILRRANPNTIQDKFLVGYQGWFTCPGDGEPVGPGHHGWLHWFDKPIPQGGRPNLDLWPDVSSYSPSELYPAPGLSIKSGEPAMLFSSRNAKTVQRHFHWMAEHGVDGAFLQRFASQCDTKVGHEGIRRIRDEVGDRVREAAEREGRVFAIMYDVTGVPPEHIQRVLEQDWLHLLHNKRILDSPNYLKEGGRPVVALWGFGFDNARHSPALVRRIAQFFRNATPGGAYLMAGTPTHWRTGEGDADRNPEFVDVWLNEFDAISPWTIGRYKTEDEADAFAETKMKADADLLKRRNEEGRSRRIDYIPVVFPGGSGYHLSEGKWAFNDAPRKGGRFLWKQVFNARRAGAHIIYGAMWDEYDEGTAFLPAVANKKNLPVSEKWNFLALDAEGHDLPSDWYMRICGFAAEGLRNERRIFDSFPSKELQDYWGNRPKYEEVSAKPADFVSGYDSGTSRNAGEDNGQTYEEWLANQRTKVEEAPPPPYSLEFEEPELAAAAVPASSSTAPVVNVSNAAPPPPSGYPPPSNHQAYDNSSISVLANDFNRLGWAQTNSGQSYSPSLSQSEPSPTSGYQPGRKSSTPSPLHPTHSGTQSCGPSTYGRLDSQTQPSTLTGFQSRPSSHGRPTAQATSAVAAPPVPSTPTGSGWSQSQWPPSEWGVSRTSSQPPASLAPPVQYTSCGANFARPQTFSANSYNPYVRPPQTPVGSNAPPAPSPYVPSGGASLVRPPSAAPSCASNIIPSTFGATSGPADNGNAYGGSTSMPLYGSSNLPGFPSSNTPGHSTSGYSMPHQPSSYTASPGPSFPESQSVHHSGSIHFPSAPNTYAPYPSGGGPSFPNSSYQQMSHHVGGTDGFVFPEASSPVPHWTAGGGGPSPHPSSPISPSGMNGFVVQNSYPDPAIRPNQSSSLAYGRNAPHLQHSAGPQFPHATGGEMNYFGNNSTMPQSHASNYLNANAAAAEQHGIMSSSYHQLSNTSSSSSHPSAQSSSSSGSTNPSQSIPWMSGGAGGSLQSGQRPPLPPRPSNYTSASSSSSLYLSSSSSTSSSTSGPGGGALGFALSAVDKVAGRKTREQLETQVGNLAQTGSNLFGMFTK